MIISDIGILDSIDTKIEDPKTKDRTPTDKKVYIESYGCQMNFSDSEIVASILQEQGYASTNNAQEADLVFLNTCAIRENAEQKIRKRLQEINASLRKDNPELVVGVLGCMAERLKSQFLIEEKVVDLVVGPDAYRDLPNMLMEVNDGRKAVNVYLSREETYAGITPVRLHTNGITALVSIMRGCDNMCSFCVVPFTRGRERSRDPASILEEVQDLVSKGYKEVTLLGQNVDSYKWEKQAETLVTFAHLLEKVALISPDLRVRFSTSHPKDLTNDVLHTIAQYENICNSIHLPVQSGSSRVLDLMNRTYTREWYMERIDSIRTILGNDCGISSDTISGFCTETEEDHEQTLSLMEYAKYDFSYMFEYSERPNTPAAKKLKDDVDAATKKRRLQEIIDLQGKLSLERNRLDIGKTLKVLAEGYSKKSDQDLQGRTSTNKVVVFPKAIVDATITSSADIETHIGTNQASQTETNLENHILSSPSIGVQIGTSREAQIGPSREAKIGHYVWVKITDCTRATLLGHIVPAPIV